MSHRLVNTQRPLVRTLGPAPTLKELNLICWGLFVTFLVLPLCGVVYLHQRSGLPLLNDAELDFVYLYGMGKIFNERPSAELYDWFVQKKVCADIQPLKKGQYGPIPYHPYVGILFRPFARLPFLAAYLLWISVSIALYVAGIAAVSNCYFHGEPLRRSLIYCFALAFYPFCWTIMTGHLPALGFFALSMVLTQEHRGRAVMSGLALSLCVYKPTLLVLIVPMLLITRRFRTLLGFAAGSIALSLFATAVQGVGFWPGYFKMLFSFGRGAARVQTHTFKELWKYVDVSSFSSAIASRLPNGISSSALLLLVGFAVFFGAWLVLIWWKSQGCAQAARPLVWAVTLTWTLVLNVYVPIYDCLLAVIGVIVTAGVLQDCQRSAFRGQFTAAWLLIFGSSWITTDVAEKSGLQLITVLFVALGFVQLTVLSKVIFGAHRTVLEGVDSKTG